MPAGFSPAASGADHHAASCVFSCNARCTPTWLSLTPSRASAAAILRRLKSFVAQLAHAPDRPLLLGHFNQLAAVALGPTERDDAAEIAAPAPLVALDVGDALAGAVALRLGDRGQGW